MICTSGCTRLLRIFLLSISIFLFDKVQAAEVSCYIYNISGLYKPEMFFGKNLSLLNSNNTSDKVFFARHTLDLTGSIVRKECADTLVEFLCTARNKAIWGNPASIASTTDTPIKNLVAVLGSHRHSIPRHIFWIRELWLAQDLSYMFNLCLPTHPMFKLGLFPFQLGRGISLGDAFAISAPELLGFYTDTSIDQFAPGALLTGDIILKELQYDLYASIINNKSSSLSDTAERIRGQEFGRRFNPIRGFGVINYVVAGRLRWSPFNNDLGKLTMEPYWLYNNDPEQNVHTLGDATSKLGTLGVAGEYTGSCFELGFDCAFNVGQQRVKALDRNQVISENRDGRPAFVNSHVVNAADNKKIPFVSDTNAAQELIYNDFDNEYSENKNGQIIATVPGDIGFVAGPVAMKNASNRFRDPYTNKYKGWMTVVDGGIWLYKKELQWNATAGVASGDDNPNFDTFDREYRGFISLQELYSGKRVRSAFVLGGAGKIKRPLSTPDDDQAPTKFAVSVSGFTNIVFCGTSLMWNPSECLKGLSVNPNIIAYWQEFATPKFDLVTKKTLPKDPASNFLGTEVNLFLKYQLIDSLKVYFVGSIFVPGQHYRDVRGLPLTADQSAALDRVDVTGFTQERVPNLGDDVAYTYNMGFEFKF